MYWYSRSPKSYFLSNANDFEISLVRTDHIRLVKRISPFLCNQCHAHRLRHLITLGLMKVNALSLFSQEITEDWHDVYGISACVPCSDYVDRSDVWFKLASRTSIFSRLYSPHYIRSVVLEAMVSNYNPQILWWCNYLSPPLKPASGKALLIFSTSHQLSERFECGLFSWRRHQMETFSALLALCAWNAPVGDRWIRLTKASDAELWCFLWSPPWINGWVNNHEASDLRCHRAHYDVIAMCCA